MTNNPNNTKYKSALDNLPFEVRRADDGQKMKSQEFYLVPVFRKEPDIERLGRAILTLADLEFAKQKDQAETESTRSRNNISYF